LTFAGKPKEGEEFIQVSLALDPEQPNAYSLLAQNYQMQGRKQEALAIVSEMQQHQFSDTTLDKVEEALKCIGELFGTSSAEYTNLKRCFKNQYPSLL